MYNNSDSNRPPRPKKDVCPTRVPNVGRLTEATILLPRLAGQRPALQSIYSNKERYWTFPKNHSIRSRFYRLLGWIALCMTAFCAHGSQQDSEMLVAAIEKGELQWVQERVTKENIDAILSNAMTALHVATYHGQLAGAQYLLDTGADPNIANRYGVTPLMLGRKWRQYLRVAPIESGSRPQQNLSGRRNAAHARRARRKARLHRIFA